MTPRQAAELLNPLLRSALSYAKRGWAVFPLLPGTKNPFPGSHAGLDATTDENQIVSWWLSYPTANIGLNMMKSSLVGLDLDMKDGLDGIGSWRTLAAQHHIDDSQALVQLTPNAGLHLIFRANGHHVANSTDKLGLGIEVRADGGHYLAVAPSEVGGKAYVWEASAHPDDRDPGPLPPELIALLEQPEPPTTRTQLPEQIQDGTRNRTLFSRACALRAQGLSEDEILATLRQINQTRVKPPKPDDELAKIAASACKYTAGTAELHCTDLGNALRLAIIHGDDLRFCEPWDKWLVWDGRRWATDATGEIMRRAKDIPKGIYTAAGQCKDADQRKALALWWLRSEAAERLQALIRLARSDLPITPDDLDTEPWLLTVQNGTVDLHTGDLQAHQRDDLVTKLAPVAYKPADACPLWMAFLNQILAQNQTLIEFLQCAIGYSLTGDTSERVLFLLYGTGKNGKTTFLETIRAILGDYALRTPTSTLMTHRHDIIPNDVARLRGARFVSASESEENRRLAESLIKDLTGQDTVSARFLFGEWFDFRPECKVWLGTNHKPQIRGTDNAIWDRIRLVPFTVRIPDDQQDPHLREKLLTEAPGILAWAVRGCLAWQQEGRLKPPSEVVHATAAYRQEMDVLGPFIEDCCVVQQGAEATSKDLHAAFVNWCVTNGESAMSKVQLGQRLAEMGFVPAVRPGKPQLRIWRGIGLLITPAQQVLETL